MRTLNLTVVLALAASLVSCSLLRQPEPNAALVNLAAQAHYDASTFQTQALKDLRAGDATELEAEILRECGHREDGSQPETCDAEDVALRVDQAEVDSRQGMELFDASASNIVAHLGGLPQDSLAVVVPQIIDLVAAGAAPPSTGAAQLSMNDALKTAGVDADDLQRDVEDARTALRHEYAARYTLGVAQAYAAPSLAVRLNAQREAHQQRIDLLEASLATTGEVPVADAAYAISGTVPTDAASAQIFADELQRSTLETYMHLASQARTASWRELTAAFAAQSTH